MARDLTLREILLRSELEATKADNSRLLKLLISTPEYKAFYRYWEDSEGVHYRTGVGPYSPAVMGYSMSSHKANRPPPPPPKRYPTGSKDGSPPVPPQTCWLELEKMAHMYPMGLEAANDIKKEILAWVPSRAIQVAKEFWIRHLAHVPASVIDRFVLEVNEIWRMREEKRLDRLKHRLVRRTIEVIGSCRAC